MNDLQHKHHALIWVFLLGLIFIVIAAWTILRSPRPLIPTAQAPAATSSPATITAEPVVIQDSSRFYDIVGRYPSATPLAESANAAAVAAMRTFVEQEIAQFKRDGNFENLSAEDIAMIFPDDRKYALDIEYKTYTGPRTVSYVFLIYSNTLGAHPNASYKTFTFDTQTGAQVSLGDLFTPSSDYLNRLAARARSELPVILTQKLQGGEPDADMLADGTAPTVENYAWFKIDGTRLVLIFPPYQIGPWAVGTTELPIPLSQISSILEPEYAP